jgi:tRNA pseudouridine55 synthase
MINGILNVKKEKGMTSFDVIYRLRKIFDQQKMGHTGTLDPEAEGVLPVCMGKATRLVSMLTGTTKTYEAVLLLGVSTDTEDMTGKVLAEKEVTAGEEEVSSVIASFAGKQMQMPPMYSAVKVGGHKLVDLARKGVEVERQPREVEFSELEILEMNLPRVHFRVTCSKGSFIRTLCADIGKKLGCGGAMESLVRTRVGNFHLEDSLTLDEIRKKKEEEDGVTRNAASPYSFLIPLEEMFSEMPVLTCPPSMDQRLINGNDFEIPEENGRPDLQEVRVHTSAGKFIGIYRFDKKYGMFRLVKNFYDPD